MTAYAQRLGTNVTGDEPLQHGSVLKREPPEFATIEISDWLAEVHRRTPSWFGILRRWAAASQMAGQNKFLAQDHKILTRSFSFFISERLLDFSGD
jgi:hypothetical protein